MAYNENMSCISLNAPSTAFSGSQYRMVKPSTAPGYFAAGSTKPTGEKISIGPIGVLQDAPTVTGEACQICTDGITKLVCGSTILAPGDHFIMGTVGTAQSTGSVVAQDWICGIWLSAAASTDTIGSALFRVQGITT